MREKYCFLSTATAKEKKIKRNMKMNDHLMAIKNYETDEKY